MPIAIIVHGGAWDIPTELHADHLAGCRQAVSAGWAVLGRGGSAVAAVEAAIRSMEDDPVFDAGRGSHLNRDGEVELDAAIMQGDTLAAGAVAAVKRLANPITAARLVMEGGDHVLLVGQGAERFAQAAGESFCAPERLVVERERLAWEERRRQGYVSPQSEFMQMGSDTVGAIVVDEQGNLVVGNSTGGTFYKRPGRVGDTPIIGCGLYADNQLGAAACTGWGEQIVKTVLAKSAVDQVALLADPQAAAKMAMGYFRYRINGLGGIICAAPDGRVGWAHTTPYMACAYRLPGMPQAQAHIRRSE